MTGWYYADAGRQRHGPVPADVLVHRYREGLLPLDSLVWREGMAGWQPLADFREELALPDLEAGIEAAAVAPSLVADPEAPAPDAPVHPAVDQGAEIVYAGFWKRVAANFIDSLVVGVVGGMIGFVIGLFMAAYFGLGNAAEGAAYIWIQVVTNLFSIAITAAYYAWFHASRHQATLGKLAIGIKVVRGNGEPILLGRGVGRYFAFVLSSLLLGIGLLMAAFTQRKQALHDLMCDTLVVDKWAFTDHPEWQRPELGTVTIVVLALFGLLMLFVLALLVVVVVMAANASNWT